MNKPAVIYWSGPGNAPAAAEAFAEGGGKAGAEPPLPLCDA